MNIFIGVPALLMDTTVKTDVTETFSFGEQKNIKNKNLQTNLHIYNIKTEITIRYPSLPSCKSFSKSRAYNWSVIFLKQKQKKKRLGI